MKDTSLDKLLSMWGAWSRREFAEVGAPPENAESASWQKMGDWDRYPDTDPLPAEFNELLMETIHLAIYELPPMRANLIRWHYRDRYMVDRHKLKRARDMLEKFL